MIGLMRRIRDTKLALQFEKKLDNVPCTLTNRRKKYMDCPPVESRILRIYLGSWS